jgi:carbamate kinase
MDEKTRGGMRHPEGRKKVSIRGGGGITSCERGPNMTGVYAVSDRGFVSQNLSHNPTPIMFCAITINI